MYCAYNVLSVVAAHALALVYPDTAVPVNVPSLFNILFPSLAASYHPANVHPVLLALGIVVVVVFLIPEYTTDTPFFVYTVPPPVPPLLVALNVNFALFTVTNVSAVVRLVLVSVVFVPSLAYTRQEYHLCPTKLVATEYVALV